MSDDTTTPMNAKGVVRYLLDTGLLDAEDIVRSGVTVEERSRRNLNFVVLVEDGGLFVKQGLGADKRRTARSESAAYRTIRAFDQLGEYLVPARHFDAGRSIQVLDLVPSATSLRDHYVRTRRVPVVTMRALGLALAHLHNGAVPDGLSSRLRRGPAEAMSIHRPSSAAADSTSRAGRAVISIIQADAGFGHALDSATAEWRYERIIHGDVRWDNCLVFPSVGSRRVTRLKLVDWELARVGDPAWDIGCVFAEYLGAWVASIPATAELRPERAVSAAGMPLDRFHAGLAAFCGAYRNARSGEDDLDDLGVRAVRFAAARLVQTAFERADRSTWLPTMSVICLQLARNLLNGPRQGGRRLLGMDLRWA